MGCTASSRPERQRFAKTYRLSQKLAKGTFGDVHVATHVPSGAEYAVKVLAVPPLDEPAHLRRRLAEKAKHELMLWRLVGRYEHCVELLGDFVEPHAVYFVMELCRCSFKAALPQLQRLELPEVARLLRESLQGAGHLHSLGLVHRDLKPENLLLGGPTGWTVKVCDFGVAARLPQIGVLRGACGTAHYMSPEMVANAPYDDRTDVWSLGVVAHVLLLMDLPYPLRGKSCTAVKQAILDDRPPLSVADRPPPPGRTGTLWGSALGCVEALLQRSPAKRPRAAAALLLPTFRFHDIDEVASWEQMTSTTGDSAASSTNAGGFCTTFADGGYNSSQLSVPDSSRTRQAVAAGRLLLP